jgi:hypothetical protein
LVPPPEHVTVHVVRDPVLAMEEQGLVLEDRGVAGWDGPTVNGLGVRT